MAWGTMLAAVALLVSTAELARAIIPTPTSITHFEVPVDHNDASTNRKTFQMRVLHYDKFAKADGPIFFYAGNEGPITSFYNNTGLPFAWAEEFGADIVFAEHRYYGETMPFGKDSFENENLRYLRVEQAMNDYGLFMRDYNVEVDGKRKKVVVFGGSYGGVLAAFLRMRFPTLFDAAIAASAPVPECFNMHVNPNDFYMAVTQDAARYDAECPDNVRRGYAMAKSIFDGGNAEDLKRLTETFNLCRDLKPEDWEHFLQYTRNGFTEMAMCNYPYASSFLAPLPAWPVGFACGKFRNHSGDYLAGLAAAVSLPYGSVTDKTKCLDMDSLYVVCADQTGCGTGDAGKAWDYQMCADIGYVVASTNVTDMFPPYHWSQEHLHDYCGEKYGIVPRPDDMSTRVGIWDYFPKSDAYGKIVWSNGLLDPWHSGGYLESFSADAPAITIELGAHHLDLREPHKDDPQCVVDARLQEKAYVKRWIGFGSGAEASGEIKEDASNKLPGVHI